ncbi:MAG: glycoside hydrolase family 99-like domain-containing protein, partial [Desulfobacterales bacterium]|nr:glycoside hydrolase family 99-like domain-containing protein [Desulfobacterales bacterium]
MTKLWSFYLPQFHPIPENNAWWGEGFTEWSNVKTAKPQFLKHYQPHRPIGGGYKDYYDLRDPQVMVRQSLLARRFGIHGFVFYHYWFSGKRLLEAPVNSLLGNSDFTMPFCLCWANEGWSRRWDGLDSDVLMPQTYSREDDEKHIRSLLPIFKDKRYFKHRGRPVFIVYRSEQLPDPERTVEIWRHEVRKAGFDDLYLIRVEGFQGDFDPLQHGFDAAIEFAPDWRCLQRRVSLNTDNRWLEESASWVPGTVDNRVFLYDDVVKAMLSKEKPLYTRYRGVFPAWDNCARRQKLGGGTIIHASSPAKYQHFLETVIEKTRAEFQDEDRLIFINAWNEWGEGCHLEPDKKYGDKYLRATRSALRKFGEHGLTDTFRSLFTR